jgi:hypothetical protein
VKVGRSFPSNDSYGRQDIGGGVHQEQPEAGELPRTLGVNVPCSVCERKWTG